MIDQIGIVSSAAMLPLQNKSKGSSILDCVKLIKIYRKIYHACSLGKDRRATCKGFLVMMMLSKHL